MATVTPKICGYPGCGTITRGSRCKDHPVKSNWDTERRPNRHLRGYGKQWRITRGKVLRRDKNLCQPCLALGVYTKAFAVDHIVPKSQQGTDDPSNLQAICKACHATKTAKEGGIKPTANQTGTN